MSKLSGTSFGNLYGTSGTTFPDNTTGEISEGDMRTFGKDIQDSFLNITDHLQDDDTFASASATKVASSESIKAYVDSLTSASLLTVTKTLTTAEILSGNSSPVTLLAAQGAGTIIQIMSPIIWKWNYATAAFATNTSARMYYNSLAPLTAANTVIGLASTRYEVLAVSDVDHTTANMANVPITWLVSSGNPTAGGTSTLTIHFKYYVLTL